ncbi:hypothetical protein [Piscinibacterium candidicorallinum]|uniref:Carboxypeptidase regulatory-like domain-containing protein n=1 Tax=Piscinibacterium candidicorallinum TaxID=1793872 RepID=A0ABV7HAA7_9BURK
MSYVFKGSLRGALCGDCIEPLAGLTLKLYRVDADARTTALAVAAAKDTFGPVDDAAAAAKAGRLLAEGLIDDQGNFSIGLSEKNYDGGPFELDLWCPTVPHLKPGPRPPVPLQFGITVLQPLWRQTEREQIAAWEYVIPHRAWCGVRGRFGAWTICGHVRHCETQAPIGGVRVRAFDVDWLQDDDLGSAVTNAAGHFRIDYLASDFKRTIFSPSINLEWTGGPDLYFRVETLGGTPLLNEPPSRGRAPDRENAGPCFCVDLCLKEQPRTNEPLPVFDALGGYLFASQIDSAVPGSGKTVGDHRAFYSTVRLNGVLPKTLNGQPLEYRFEYRSTDASGNPTGPWTHVAPAQCSATFIGRNERYAPAFPGDPNPVKTRYIYADPAVPGGGPDNAQIVGGWIRVPQAANVFAPEGFFNPNGNMLNVITGALAASPSIDVNGVKGGDSSTVFGAIFASNRHVGLRMRVREVGNPASETDAGTCAHVAIENVRYQNVSKGGAWAPFKLSDQLAVVSVDVLQLRANGCAGVQAGLDVVITATHPNLGAVNVSMQGPGGPYAFTLPAAGPNERVGACAPSGFTVAGLADCAYIIDLSAELLLTTGDSAPLPVTDRIGFCKK